MTRFAALVRIARGLLAEGALGGDFWARLGDLHPELTPRERTRLARKIRPEVGVLGHALHDPGQYRSCQAAADVLRKHPHRDSIVAVRRTPLCASCGYNRRGRCALMDAVIAKNAANLPEATIRPTVQALARRGTLPVADAESIAASRLTPSRKVASLHLRSHLVPADTTAEDTTVRAEAVRTAALVDPVPAGLTIRPTRRGIPGRVANAEREPLDVARQPGDDREERRSRSLAAAFRAPGLTIDPAPQHLSGPRSLALTASPHLDAPPRDRRSRKASTREQDTDACRRDYERTLAAVRQRLADGRLSATRAVAYLAILEEAPYRGITPTRIARRLTRQVALLAGRYGV